MGGGGVRSISDSRQTSTLSEVTESMSGDEYQYVVVSLCLSRGVKTSQEIVLRTVIRCCAGRTDHKQTNTAEYFLLVSTTYPSDDMLISSRVVE